MKLYLIGSILFIIATFGHLRKLPSYITPCKQNDPKINECWMKNFYEVRKHIADGIPELNIIPLEPVLMEKVHINFGGQTASVNFDAELFNIKLYGLSSTTLKKCDVKIGKEIEISLFTHVASTYIDSEYKAKGKVLLLQFDTAGAYRGNYTDLTVNGVWYGKRYMKKGKEYVNFDNSTLTIDIKSFNSYFGNLFPNNKELTENINKAINENTNALYDEIKPVVAETVKAIMRKMVNGIYELFPLNVLYPEN